MCYTLIVKPSKESGTHLHTVKNKVYDNCPMFDPDGLLIAHIPEKRAKWYLKKELAMKIGEAPLSIRLTFPPKRSELRTVIRKNVCVVCGTAEDLTRHHTVPDTIRKHLPHQYKSKVSHDILAVCAPCHSEYEIKISRSNTIQIPLIKEASKVSSRLQQVAKLLLNILEYSEGLVGPRLERIHHRVKQLTSELPDYVENLFPYLKDYSSDVNLSLEQLGELQESHRTVTAYLVQRDIKNIPDFIFSCRKSFVDMMNPQFLPEDWDIYFQKWKEDD